MKKKLLNLDERIAHDIRMKIESGICSAGELLPGERELSLLYGVQRGTVRSALQRLVDEALVTVKSRCGYLVCPPRYVIDVGKIMDFEDRAVEKDFAWDDVFIREERLTKETANKMQLNVGLYVLSLQRCGVVSEERVCMERWMIPKERLDGKKLSGYEKMHAYLAVLGCRPVYMNQLMDIVYATREEAELLQKKALAPLIQLRGYAYDLSGAFFHYYECLMKPEKFEFTADDNVYKEVRG